jgi:FKBP-type peptidyl-prolyl cis-trans isomerase SlyD
MKVAKDKVVSLSYELKVNGEVVDSADAQNPLEFLYGRGMLLPRFEQNIDNLAQGDVFQFSIPCAEGYGEVEEEAVVELPKSIFEIEGKVDEELLVVGKRLPMLDNEGHSLFGTVLEIQPDHVVMDFNHPLAGADLHFTGKVEVIRDASAEELAHGHVHGHGHDHHHDHDHDDNHGGCGCGCN